MSSFEHAEKLMTTKIQLSIKSADVLILFMTFKFLVTICFISGANIQRTSASFQTFLVFLSKFVATWKQICDRIQAMA